jgi:hypothetical protein
VLLTRLAPVAVFLLVLPACDAFTPRAPEEPSRGAGTFLQPDTPQRVVENLQYAISELSVQNYRRSLSEDLVFRPAATAEAASPIFTGWSRLDEERYFSTVVAASDPTAQHSLRIEDATTSPRGNDEFVVDGTYVLKINHARSEVPTEFQGRVIWTIAQDADGLWRLKEWTDQELSAEIPSWSMLKAEFGR